MAGSSAEGRARQGVPSAADEGGARPPSRPSQRAPASLLAAEGPAREAVHRMLAILGTVMADAALSMGCWRGAVIAGGIVAQLSPLLDNSPFAMRFRHQGKMGQLLSDIPVWLSVDSKAGLRGAAAAFENASLQSRVLSRA